MNERGLLNSSQAIGAGQAALYEAATPIATANAAAYNNAMTNTANAANRASEFGADATNTASSQNAQFGTNTSQFNAAAANTAAGATAAGGMAAASSISPASDSWCAFRITTRLEIERWAKGWERWYRRPPSDWRLPCC